MHSKDLINILLSPWICLVWELSLVGPSMHDSLGQMHDLLLNELKIGRIIYFIYPKGINKSAYDYFWMVNQSITINQLQSIKSIN